MRSFQKEEIVYNSTPLFHPKDKKSYQEDLHYKKRHEQILLTNLLQIISPPKQATIMTASKNILP